MLKCLLNRLMKKFNVLSQMKTIFDANGISLNDAVAKAKVEADRIGKEVKSELETWESDERKVQEDYNRQMNALRGRKALIMGNKTKADEITAAVDFFKAVE